MVCTMTPSVRRATKAMQIRSNLSLLASKGVIGAAKAHKALNNSWSRRTGGTGNYHKNGKPSACVVTTYGSAS